MAETISALRELNEHPDTVFTVLTGVGRFFSAGADVKGITRATLSTKTTWPDSNEHSQLSAHKRSRITPLQRRRRSRSYRDSVPVSAPGKLCPANVYA